MNTWEEVEQQPEFGVLTPEDRASVHDEWHKSVLNTLADEDPEQINSAGVNRFIATERARNKALVAGGAFDPDAAQKEYDQEVRGRASAQKKALEDYDALEKAQFALRDAEDARTSAMLSETYLGEGARLLEQNIEGRKQTLALIEGRYKPEQLQQAKEAREALKGERDTAVLGSDLYTSPTLVLDKDKYRAAVAASNAPPEAKARAMADFTAKRQQVAAEALRAFRIGGESPIPGAQDFPTWEAEQPEDVRKLAPEEKALKYMKAMEGRGDFRKLASAIGTGLMQGGTDIASQGIGVAALVSNSAPLAEKAAEVAKGAEVQEEIARLEGEKQATGATTVAGAARLLPPMAATIAPAALTGGASLGVAATLAGAQTAGAQFPTTYTTLREQGMSEEQALTASRNAAIASGLITSGLTAAFGATGAEAALLTGAGGKELVKSRLLATLKAIPKGAAAEIPEELLDEVASQVIEQRTVDPTKPVSQIVDEFSQTAPDLAMQIALLGGVGGAIGGFRGSTTIPAGAAPVAPTEGTPAPVSPQTPVEVNGQTIAYIPQDSDLTPEDVAMYAAEPGGPDLLKRMAARGYITLPEIVTPVEGVDPAITQQMNDNVAAAATLAPGTVEALKASEAALNEQLRAQEETPAPQQVSPVTPPATETPIDAANVDGGSQSVQTEPAEGSIPAVTEDIVPPPAGESTAEIQPEVEQKLTAPPPEAQAIPLDQIAAIPEDLARAEASREANDSRWQRASQSREPIRALRLPDGTLRITDGHHRYVAARERGDATIPAIVEETQPTPTDGPRQNIRPVNEGRRAAVKERANTDPTTQQKSVLPAPQLETDGQAPSPTLAEEPLVEVAQPQDVSAGVENWIPTPNAPASFIAANGERLVGTVQSVEGGNAVVSFPWNGKSVTRRMPVGRLARPVAALAQAPRYQYTQQENTRKAGKHIPTTPGVHENFDFRKAFASMAEDTSLSRIYREIAKQLAAMPAFANMDLHIVADGRKGYAGEYSHTNGKSAIAVNLRQVARGNVDALGTILHEALHHVTLAKVRAPQGTVETESAQALDQIRQRVKAYAGSQGKSGVFEYELGTNEEFISAIFTRPDFQDFLASIPDNFSPATGAGKFRSLLSEIFRLIAQLVTGKHVAKGSTMEQSMTTILALFETPHRTLDVGPLGKLSAVQSKPVGYRTPADMLAKTASTMKGMTVNPFQEPPQIDLAAAYQKAVKGQSTAWVSIKGVYDQAKAADPALTPEAFMAHISEQNEAGGIMVSPAERLETIEAARPFVVGGAGVEMLVPEPSTGGVSRGVSAKIKAFPEPFDNVPDAPSNLFTYDARPPSDLTPQEQDALRILREDLGGERLTPVRITGLRHQPNGSGRGTDSRGELSKWSQSFTKLFGKRVLFFDGPVSLNGAVAGDQRNVILVNVNGVDPLLYILGHELTHSLRAQQPKLYAELEAKMLASGKDLDSYRAKLQALGYSSEELNEEMLADFVGGQFLEPDFLNRLAATEPSLFERFAQAAVKFLDTLLRKITDLSRDIRPHFEGRVTELRDALVKALKAYSASGHFPDNPLGGARASKSLVTPAQDAEYTAAVEAGDMAKAQRMVDEAAKAAGYNVGPVYHGTEQKGLTEFYGGWWSDTKKVTREFGSQRYSAYLKGPLADGDTLRQLYKEYNGTDIDQDSDEPLYDSEIGDAAMAGSKFQELVRSKGYQGIEVWDESNAVTAMAYAVFEPNQIKSADPVTRDEAGNVIPLSQRFNPESNSTLYSLADTDGTIPPTIDIGGESEPADGKGKQLYEKDTTAIGSTYVTPADITLQEKRAQEETLAAARTIIGESVKADGPIKGRRAALDRFRLDTSIPPEVRAVGTGLIAQQSDILANLEEGNQQLLLDEMTDEAAKLSGVIASDPDSFKNLKADANLLIDKMAEEAGRTLNIFNVFRRLTPEGFLRRMTRKYNDAVREKVDQNFDIPAAEVESEIARLWRAMQDAGATKRGEAIAAALKAFMPRRVNTTKIIESLFPQADTRQRMSRGGEALVRNFFQMMAGPRDSKGPLAEFDETIQGALSGMLRKVMEAQGLVAKNASNQMTDIDKMVRSVSSDELRFDKIAAADEAMQKELAGIKDPERRATLQQAWEEATAKMYTNIASDATVRRAINAELKDLKVDWTKMFDANQKPAAIRDKVVEAVMGKIEALLTDPANPTVRNNLKMLRDEVGAAFDFIADNKHTAWLAQREAIEARRRVAEHRAAFMEALRNQGVAEQAINRISEKLAGPQRGKPDQNPVSALVGEHMKKEVPDFVDKLVALDVDRATAEKLDQAASTLRTEIAAAEKLKAADRAVAQLMKSLKPKPRAPREKIEKSLKALFTADTVGALDDQAFFDAFGEAFGLPPLSGEQQAKIKKLIREINALPKGPARLDKQQDLDEELGLWKGIAARDVLLSAWYANILSGVSTQGMGLLGNLLNFVPRSLFNVIVNPRSAGAYFKGAFGEGLTTGIEEAKAALKGRGLYKVSKYGDKNIVSALELLRKKGPSTLPEWVAYIASAGARLRYVFRIMQAIDALAWNTAREGHAYLAAHRALLEQDKLTGTKRSPEEFYKAYIDSLGGDTAQIEEDLRAARQTLIDAGQTPALLTVDRMAREARNARRVAGGVKAANRFADRIVLQQEPEGSGRFISSLIDVFQKKGNVLGVPVGQLLIPFNKIVSNLFEQSLDYTPVGALRAYLGGHLSDVKGINLKGQVEFKEGATQFDPMERRERAMAAVTGMAATVILYALAYSHKDEPDEDVPLMVYGWGPESKTKRAQMPKGWVPYSIKIDDKYIKFSEMPFGMMFAAAGAAMDAVRYKNMDKKTSSQRLAYILKTSAKGFMNQGVMSSLDTAMETLMFDASEKKMADIPVNAVKGLVPAQGLLRDISTIMDPSKVSNESLTSALLRDIPFAKSYGTKPDLNVFGEPIKLDGYPITRRIITHREPHAVADYLGRNDLHIPGMDQTIEIGKYLPDKVHDRIQARAVELGAMENGMFTPEQNYTFKKRAGELTKVAIQEIMKEAPKVATEEQRKQVQSVIDKRVENARRRAMLEAVPLK